MENTIENALNFIRSNLEKMSSVEMMVAYAASVRHEVKLPSERDGGVTEFDNAYDCGWNNAIAEIKRLDDITE